MSFSIIKIQRIYIIYWVMLAYIVAALVWWYIALDNQIEDMTAFRISELDLNDPNYEKELSLIKDFRNRKSAQYIGEGVTFLLLIMGVAVFVFRAVRNQFKLSHERQTFMMAITHELKTPIAVSKLNLETLMKRKLDESIQQKFLQNTLEEINRLNALSTNLLLSSQIESGALFYTPEKLNLSELLESCVLDNKGRFPARSFVYEIEKDIFYEADRFKLQIVFNNLMENAVKYSKDVIHISLAKIGNNIEVRFSDLGPGISQDNKLKIFQKFYRVGNEATRTSKGTGLGLYLVSKIIAKHRGLIRIADNKPTGSIFTISLPV